MKTKIWRIIWSLILLLGIAAIAAFPFENRSLELCFSTDQGTITVHKNSLEIAQEKEQTFIFPQKASVQINSVSIYGSIKSMYLKKISYSEFASYVAQISGGEMQWQDKSLLFKASNGAENVEIGMNEVFSEMLKELSSSFLMERIIMMLAYVAVMLFVLLLMMATQEKITEGNRSNHGPIYEAKRFFRDICRYREYVVYAAKADLRAEVADSYLNRLWWLLEPMFNMLVYVLVFGNFMGSNIENYATFVFSALLMWNFFNKTINYSVKLVRNNKDIVTKVYIPKFIILISNMILNLFKLLFSLIVLVGMLVIFRVHIGINVLWVLPAYALMLLLSFGLGMIFLHFGVYVDDLSYAVGILLNMLMFLSGVFYELMVTLPSPLNEVFICLNPVAIFVDVMRNALLYNVVADLPVLLIWLAISILFCCVGVHIVYKNENGYVKVV